MSRPVVRLASVLVCGCVALAACGKRGNPMPPLQRIPAAPTDLAVSRVADDVYISVTVPAANIDGARPPDVARLEVYAVTLDVDPRLLATLPPADLRELSTLVATEPVRRPVPPPPAVKEGLPPIPMPPPAPGVDPGEAVVVRDVLTPGTHTPATLPPVVIRGNEGPVHQEDDVMPWPLGTLAADRGVQRYYYAVAVSARGRYGPATGLQPAPLGPTSGPPSEPRIEVAETSMTLRWTPPVDARGATATETDPEWLPSRSLIPSPPATTYDVYEVPRNETAAGPAGPPVPLTAAPVSASVWTSDNATLGGERCFYVRAVDTIEGVSVRGPASPVGCASFADVFPPSPPLDLLAASVPGSINLIWEPSTAKDVEGYVVLRGEAGSATLAPLTTVPATALRYRDDAVQSGVRYVYAVVAVDRSGNRSEESNRAEETAR